MSATGSAKVPNDWSCAGDVNLEEQAEWYRVMFEKTGKRDWMSGYGLWDWAWCQYHMDDADKNQGYDIFGKPSEAVVKEYFMKKK